MDLLRWFDSERRELPWRESRDPYRIWVSEIMLQQTQVATVIPYYKAFLTKFPSLEALADASVDEVLTQWSGLGYYRRARQMHAAAQKLVASGCGFPQTAEQLAKLPGIGSYTSAAIASIAFNEVVPALDGNVERVISRRLALWDDPKLSASQRRLREEAAELIDPLRPGDSNQALMELGATVCSRGKPRCNRCPISDGCQGLLTGNPAQFPRSRQRRKTQSVDLVVPVVSVDGRFLLFRRALDSPLMAGLWELPNIALAQPHGRMEKRLSNKYGGLWEIGDFIGVVKHRVTFREISFYVACGKYIDSESVAEGPEAAWVDKADLDSYATSSAVSKIIKSLRDQS